MEKETSFCKEHDMRCYQLTELKENIERLLNSHESYATKDELEKAIQKIERNMIDFRVSFMKEIEVMKASERNTDLVISTIRESLAEIYSTLKSYKDSQDVIREDYARVYGTVQDIWMLLQTKFDIIEQRVDKVSTTGSTPWDVVKANSTKLIPLLYAVIGAMFFIVIKYAEHIISILLK